MIREELLRHFVTVIVPADGTDGYGDTVPDWENATETEVRGWVQQVTRGERLTTDGDRLTENWLLITNEPVTGRARIAWGDYLFTVDGPPAPQHTKAGLHHYETTLRQVIG